MTERTYGVYGLTLTDVEDTCDWADTEKDLVAHIRELQAENAKLKADRRIFGLLVARKVWDAAKDHATKVQVLGEINVPSVCLAEYVEQELNK